MSTENNEKYENTEIPIEDRFEDLVGIYHAVFKEYESAYDKISKEDDIMAILKPYLENKNFNPEDEGLKEVLVDYLLVYSQYPQEVSFFR